MEAKIQSPSTKLCLQMMLYLGLRVGESIALKRSNFNNNFSALTFLPLKKRKPTVHTRVIPAALQAHLIEYDQKFSKYYRNGYLFFPYKNQSKNEHITKSTCELWFRRMRLDLEMNDCYYVRKDGNPLFRVTPHTLRHYAIWRYYEAANKDLIVAMQIIGHEDIKTTARYINALASLNNERDIVEKAFSHFSAPEPSIVATKYI